jgi:hypothetical protein
MFEAATFVRPPHTSPDIGVNDMPPQGVGAGGGDRYCATATGRSSMTILGAHTIITTLKR